MALPAGWTARVIRFEPDTSHVPTVIEVGLLFEGPGGQSFPHRARVNALDVAGMTPRQAVLRAWADSMRPYAMRAIADRTSTRPPYVKPAIVGQVVDLT